MADAVLDEAADLLLIAGDPFDHGCVGEANFALARARLRRLACSVIALPGNHDVHDEGSVWRRIAAEEAGDHVRLLLDPDGARIELPELGAVAWGRARTEHSPENEPLAGVPRRRAGAWNIGLAHGFAVDARAGIGSSQILRAEIRDSGFDYLASCHVHTGCGAGAGRKHSAPRAEPASKVDAAAPNG